LIVTAGPYYAVTHPSNEVVAENVLRVETNGFEEPIDTKFQVLEGQQYTIDVPADQLPSAQANPTAPLDLIKARNAVAVAKAAGSKPWQRTELTDVTAKVVIYEAFVEVNLQAPKHLVRTVHDLYFEPKYDEFRGRTIWSLSKAFISVFKELEPIPQCKATPKLGEFLETRF
jgi:hypothetical protein